MSKRLLLICLMFGIYISVTGCGRTQNRGQMDVYSIPDTEAEWIRNGEPIEFDKKLWYPQDDVENLLDSEIYFLGEYKGVEFFVDKKDIKPYGRLYTKFGRDRFRYFEPLH